ncbi:MAG: hypothetical protein IPM24_04740 [Bryobacterales bacterium]|nr:hypothetical protein [Bryobacterales bacterium]
MSWLGAPQASAAELLHHQLWVAEPPACEDALTDRPAPVTAFLTTDPVFYLWFAIQEGKQGDIAASEYYTPGGQLYAPVSGAWSPLERDGNYCFTDIAFRIAAAAPATMPGTWRVLIKWNNQTLGEIRFTISPPGSTGPLPSLATGGVVNTADYTAALAPGGMISLFGTNLAQATRQAQGVPLPATLDGVSVEVVDGGRTLAAPLFFVSAGQINAQLPFGLQSASVSVRVRNARGDSQAVTMPLRGRAPRLFTRTQDGKGEAILLHAADYRLVSRDQPAQSNEYLVLYLTGLGAVTPEAVAGRPGGDGGALGALQRVTGTVTATIGGRDAVVHFAGLAPGFMGLYQVNLQAPAGLAEGAHPIVIRCDGQASQSGVLAYLGPQAAGKPEDVVRAALEAQARGDVSGLLSHAAQEGYSDTARQAAVTIFETARRGASFSDFQFTHLATTVGDKGTLAVVRGLVSAAVTARDGSFHMTRGLLGFLRKERDTWKVLTIEPDDLLNQELFESGRYSKLDGATRTADVVDLGRLNQTINQAFDQNHVNEEKLALELYFAGVGKIPIFGDGAANVYQVYDCLVDLKDAGGEVLTRGLTGIAVGKFTQVGIGILQVVSEPLPGIDTQVDLVAAAFDNLIRNAEVQRALHEAREVVRRLQLGEVKVNPRFYQGPRVLFANPAGLEVEPAGTRFSYGIPVGLLRFTAPAVLDQIVPLQVVGEIAFEANNPAVPILTKVGGEVRDNLLYLPVDVTYLVERDTSGGDAILDHFDRFRSAVSVSNTVRWVATCRRGIQQLSVQLRNGERTAPLLVNNEFMNDITSLEFQGLPAGPLDLRVGQTLSAIRVIGSSPRLEQRFWPDLTNRGECLAMAVADPRVAELQRGDTVSLTGRSAGETRWDLLLGGSAPGGGVPELSRYFTIKVEGASTDKLAQIHSTIGVVADVIGEHYVSSGAQPRRYTEDGNSFRTPTLRFGACTAKTAWNAANFDFSGTCRTSGGETAEFSMRGQVSPDLARIVTATFRSRTTTTSGLQWTEISYSVNNLEAAGFRDGGGGCTIFDFRAHREKAKNHVSNIQFTRVWLAADGSERQRDTYARTEWDRTDAVVPEVRVSFVCRLP